MVELVISMTIIGIAILGTILAINTATLFSGDPLLKYKRLRLCRKLFRRNSRKKFSNTGGSDCCVSAATRANSALQILTTFATIMDSIKCLQIKNGNAIAGLGAYTVQVTVDRQTAVLDAI